MWEGGKVGGRGGGGCGDEGREGQQTTRLTFHRRVEDVMLMETANGLH